MAWEIFLKKLVFLVLGKHKEDKAFQKEAINKVVVLK
jgi:hypothetical protein